ncbi:MAG: ribonuclease HI family protein [Thermoplasmata archaeon]|nr:ribonuclease HI family protein [Thermoplasmata archaeon]
MPDDAELPRGTVVEPLPVRVHFDGACEPARGGGIATYGFVVEGADLDHEEFGLAVPPGSERATNNVAEYVAATRALEYLVSRGFRGTVIVLGDSQLVVRQMAGEYEVRAEHLRPYHEHLGNLAARVGNVRFDWVPREENTRADLLSKRAISEARQDASLRRRAERRTGVAAGAADPADGGGAAR